jgi:hypothetical protein
MVLILVFLNYSSSNSSKTYLLVYGHQLWRASGFIVEFDEYSMTGTIFSSATVAQKIHMFPDIEKVICSYRVVVFFFGVEERDALLIYIMFIVDKSLPI